MRKIYNTLLLMVISTFSLAQSPQSFNYQAVALSNSGDPISNQSIGVRVSILTGAASGTSVYQESHNVNTNDFGLFSLMVGGGQILLGSFETISWGTEGKFLKIEMDPNGGSSYQVIGTVQLLSVPYALFAETSAGDADADPTNEIQDISLFEGDLSISKGSTIDLSNIGSDNQELSLDGSNLSISDGNTVDLTSIDKDTDDQTLALSGTDLSISEGNSVDLSSLPTSTDDQTLSLAGTDLSISEGNTVDLSGILSTDLDNDPSNEIQDLEINTNTLSITNNASSTPVDLSPYLDNTNLNEAGVEEFVTNDALDLAAGTTLNTKAINDWTSLANIPADIADGDQDVQDLSLVGTTLSLSGDVTTVSLSPFTPTWTHSGGNVYRSSGNVGIGTTAPATPLHVYSNRDALFGSSLAGNGAKVIWDYSSRAFRAGYAANSSWNEDSVGLYSSAFGFGSVASAYMSFGLGFYTHANTYAGIAVGRYNVGAKGSPSSWTNSDPLFEVGNGTSLSNRNNAFTIRKDGLIGLNDATPDYLFDIENIDLSLRSIYINHDNTLSSSTMYGVYINADNTAANSGVSYAGYFDMTNNNDDAYGLYSLAFCDATDGSPAYAIRAYVDNDNGTGAAYAIYGSVAGSSTGSKFAGYFSGDVYTTGSYLPSDRKLKTHLQPAADDATKRLMKLEVKNFEYLTGKYNMSLPTGRQTGLIAQDVEKQFPELVREAIQPEPSSEELEEGAT